MERILQHGVCILMLIAPLQAQHLGHANLSNLVPPSQEEADTVPEGCAKFPFILAHGFIPTDETQQKEITLEVTRLITARAVIGKEVAAEVQLKNSGTHAIRIPWSTDLGLPKQAPDPDRGGFEVGEFEVNLADATGSTIVLKSLSQPLLGASFSNGSLLDVAPGQWITATIRFKVEDEYSVASSLKAGTAQLTVSWRQWRRTWSVDRTACKAVRGSYYYDHLYKQQSKPLTIEVSKPT